jgi:outer membrane protein assembly factor BamB
MSNRLAVLAVLVVAPAALGDDWPHWMGPKRDNTWNETGIVDKFPAGGPKKLWSFPVAGGYAGPAVVGDLVFVTDYLTKDKVEEGNWDLKEQTGIERVFCVSAKTGKQVWKHEYPVKYKISYPAGPRCTPTVDGDLVYTLGAMGDLFAFNKADGKIVWQKQLKDEYGVKNLSIWGYAGHPLVDGKKLITLAGGEGSQVVALDKATGKELWKAETGSDEGFGYVAPSIVEYGGKRLLFSISPRAVRALDPETGKRYWSTPYSADSGSVIMIPVLSGDHLFFGGWNQKNLLVKLNRDKPDAVEVVFKDEKKKGIHAVNVQPFFQDGVMYGHDQDGKLLAVEVATGKRLWETDAVIGYAKGSDTSFIVKNGNRFFFFAETGDLVIGTMDREKFTEIDRAKKVIEPTDVAFGRKVVWCQPAFANKAMYVRNGKELVALDLAK